MSQNNLGLALKDQGRFAEAEPLYRATLDAWRRTLGPEHPQTLTSQHNLANLLRARGSLAEAEPLFRQSLEGRRRTLGPDPVERVRKAVTGRVRASITKLEEVHPPLGRHLANAVRTGVTCSYRPEQDITWHL